MLWHPIVLPPFLGLQGITRKRLGSFPIASQEFLDDIIVFVMGSAEILFLIALAGKVIAAGSWGKIGLVNWVAIGESLSLISEARCPSKVVNLHQDDLIVLFVSFVGRPHDGAGNLIVSHAGPKWLYRSLLLLGMHAVLGYRADVNCVQVGSHEFIVF